MKLEASLVRDNSRMAQIQNQLAALTIQLEEITKGKEKWNIYGAPNAGQKVTTKMNVQPLHNT
jgi:hypothetical protein